VPDITDITLPAPPAGTTAFGLRFSLTGSDPWTPYSVTNATPADADDLPITDLLNGVYTLDGLNSLTGNATLASDPNNVFQARWLTAGAHSRWGLRFVVLPSPLAAVWASAVEETLALLYVGGRALPVPNAVLVAGIRYELPRVIAYVEGPPAPDGTGGTGRLFTSTLATRLFTGNGRLALPVPEFVHPTEGGTALVVTVDGNSVAVTPGQRWGRAPWDELRSASRFAATAYGNVSVSATWGYASAVPAPLVGAVAAEVARLVEIGSQVAFAGAGETKSIGSYSINTSAGVSVWPQSSPIGVNHARFTEAIAMYRNPRALEQVRFAGLPGFGSMRL
jgi:hypothetical protein